MKVVAVINEKRTSEAALTSAIEFARENDAELAVVGIVTPQLDAPQPAYGERVRRYRQTELAVTRALGLIRESGLAAEAGIRFGKMSVEALDEAERRGAEHVFLPKASRLAFGRGVSVEHVVLRPPPQLAEKREPLAA